MGDADMADAQPYSPQAQQPEATAMTGPMGAF